MELSDQNTPQFGWLKSLRRVGNLFSRRWGQPGGADAFNPGEDGQVRSMSSVRTHLLSVLRPWGGEVTVSHPPQELVPGSVKKNKKIKKNDRNPLRSVRTTRWIQPPGSSPPPALIRILLNFLRPRGAAAPARRRCCRCGSAAQHPSVAEEEGGGSGEEELRRPLGSKCARAVNLQPAHELQQRGTR